jgi:TRAP-type C4-dicarboxylate transport system permease small subunit
VPAKKLQRVLVFIEETVPAVLLAVLVGSVAYGVLTRYVFDAPETWVNELSTALFVWQVFLAAAAAARKHLHLGVDALVTLIPGRWRAAQELLVNVAILAVLGYMIYLGWTFSLDPTKKLHMINLSYTWIYAAVPVGFFLVSLHVAADVVHAVRGLLGAEYAPPKSSIEALTEVQTDSSSSVVAR